MMRTVHYSSGSNRLLFPNSNFHNICIPLVSNFEFWNLINLISYQYSIAFISIWYTLWSVISLILWLQLHWIRSSWIRPQLLTIVSYKSNLYLLSAVLSVVCFRIYHICSWDSSDVFYLCDDVDINLRFRFCWVELMFPSDRSPLDGVYVFSCCLFMQSHSYVVL